MILLLWYNVIIIRLLLLLLQPLLIGYGKKINKVLFPWPDTAYLSGPRIPIAAVYLSHTGEGRRTRTRVFSYRYGPPGSDHLKIYALSPPSVQIARRSLASRKKCVFISTVTISLSHSFSSFYITNTLSLSLSLSLQLSAHDIIQ